MRPICLIVFLCFLGKAVCGMTPGISELQFRAFREAIKMEIAPDGLGKESPHIYPFKKPITIRCVIRNIGKRSVRFPLKDHDAYFGTLPFPIGTQVRVSQDNGELITANTIDRTGEGWWTQYSVWSTTFEPEMPGDVILLPPRGEIVRLIPVDQVLLMLPGARSGLAEGIYLIQLRINGITSNSIKIKVGPQAP